MPKMQCRIEIGQWSEVSSKNSWSGNSGELMVDGHHSILWLDMIRFQMQVNCRKQWRCQPRKVKVYHSCSYCCSQFLLDKNTGCIQMHLSEYWQNKFDTIDYSLSLSECIYLNSFEFSDGI